MDSEEKKVEPSVQATDNSVAVNNFSANDNKGDIHIGNVTNIYESTDPAKSPFLNDSIETESFEPETILIPDGPVWLGCEPAEGIPAYDAPRHKVLLTVYRISKTPITNSQYHKFVLQGGPVNSEMNWDGRNFRSGCENAAVTGVKLEDARKYCGWLSRVTARNYSIPNEAQLEKAFQGKYGCSDGGDPILQWTCTLWGLKAIAPDANYRYPWQLDERNNLDANSQIRRVVCLYPSQDGTGTRQRYGKFPWDAGFPKALHGFRVVMLA